MSDAGREKVCGMSQKHLDICRALPHTSSFMKVALVLTVLILAAAYLYSTFLDKREAASRVTIDIPYGPFTVQVSATKGETDSVARYTEVAYAILHQGKPVAFPGRLENNTGLPFLWKVYALPGAPDPTLVAGSQSLYLVYQKNGEAVAEPLVEQGSDFASLQFLDSAGGQPGVFSEVYSVSETAQIEKLDSLDGGRLLLIGEHAVLDVQTRQCRPFNTNNNPVDNYSFPAPHGALALSPDGKSIVFQANFQSWNTANEDLPDSEHALVVYDFVADSGYSIPYDDTDTRMINLHENNPEWLNTYFEWIKTPAGGYRLQPRRLEKRPNWTGRYDEKDNYYTLYPVQPDMLPVFLDFVLDQMGWSKANIVRDETGEYTGRCLELAAGDQKLDIRFQEDERKLTFSKHLYADMTPEYQQLVKKIAGAFDAQLAAGKYQEHFGRVINETRRIHGLE